MWGMLCAWWATNLMRNLRRQTSSGIPHPIHVNLWACIRGVAHATSIYSALFWKPWHWFGSCSPNGPLRNWRIDNAKVNEHSLVCFCRLAGVFENLLCPLYEWWCICEEMAGRKYFFRSQNKLTSGQGRVCHVLWGMYGMSGLIMPTSSKGARSLLIRWTLLNLVICSKATRERL